MLVPALRTAVLLPQIRSYLRLLKNWFNSSKSLFLRPSIPSTCEKGTALQPLPMLPATNSHHTRHPNCPLVWLPGCRSLVGNTSLSTLSGLPSSPSTAGRESCVPLSPALGLEPPSRSPGGSKPPPPTQHAPHAFSLCRCQACVPWFRRFRNPSQSSWEVSICTDKKQTLTENQWKDIFSNLIKVLWTDFIHKHIYR